MEQSDLSSIIKAYEKYQEDFRLKANNCRRLEFRTALAFMDKYIAQGQSILDIAAGTGAYALHYAQKGAHVTACDLVPRYVDLINEQAKASSLTMPAFVNDARDLSRFADASFDHVFCMGPIYHLTNVADRETVLRECRRVLKPGGLIYIAYINKFAVFSQLALGSRQFRQEKWYQRIVNQQMLLPADLNGDCPDFWYTTPSEMETLMGNSGFTRLHDIAQEGICGLRAEDVDSMRPEEFEQWAQFHLRSCEEPSILGMSYHGLLIGRK